MSAVTSKIEFPRNSPSKLIAMVTTLVTKHKETPDVVPIHADFIPTLANDVETVKQLREEAQKKARESVELNNRADRILGTVVGQSLDDDSTVVGKIAKYRDIGYAHNKSNVEVLKGFGFDVKLSPKKARMSKKQIEAIQKTVK